MGVQAQGRRGGGDKEIKFTPLRVYMVPERADRSQGCVGVVAPTFPGLVGLTGAMLGPHKALVGWMVHIEGRQMMAQG